MQIEKGHELDCGAHGSSRDGGLTVQSSLPSTDKAARHRNCLIPSPPNY